MNGEQYKQHPDIYSLYEALHQAYRYRYALCINGDPDEPPTNPLKYDKVLQKWLKILEDQEPLLRIPN
jgi:hypothetical protein